MPSGEIEAIDRALDDGSLRWPISFEYCDQLRDSCAVCMLWHLEFGPTRRRHHEVPAVPSRQSASTSPAAGTGAGVLLPSVAQSRKLMAATVHRYRCDFA